MLVHLTSYDTVILEKMMCMAVAPKSKNMIGASSFPQFKLGDSSIQFVNEFSARRYIF